MRTRFRGFPGILAAILCMAGGPGQAQPHAAAEHPIRRGFEAAWSRQPEQQTASLRRDASAAAIAASRRWTADAASLELTGKSDRFNDNHGAREYDATLAIPLWLPGERSRSVAVAEAGADAATAALASARWRLAEQVREAHWEQARAALERQLAQERLNNTQLLAADVAKRLRAGDLARADNHQAQAAVAVAEATLAETDVAAAKAARRWRTLTGLPVAADSDLRPEPIPVESTAQSHPALVEWSAKADAARRQRDLAGVQTWRNPELTVGTTRERDATGEPYAQSITVGVRIPLGTSSGSKTRIATAGADQLEAETQLTLERQRVEADIASAKDEVTALQASSAAAERRAGLARESRGFFEKSFRLGESDLPTRLRVELEAFEAERQMARARLELSAAVSRLRQSLGLLPE
jgi:cobalt-zinc-cadmium efflux system outer membrane protein